MKNLINEITKSGNDRFTWGEWKEIFRTNSVLILTDDSGKRDDEPLLAIQARTVVLEECTWSEEPYFPFNKVNLDLELASATQGLYVEALCHIAKSPDSRQLYQDALELSESRKEFEECVKTILANPDGDVLDDSSIKEEESIESKINVDTRQQTQILNPPTLAEVAFPKTEVLLKHQAKIKGPTIVKDVAPRRKLSVDEWRKEYKRLLDTPPLERFLWAIDGPIRLDICCEEGKAPLMRTKAYLPSIIGCDLDWFCQGEWDREIVGWTVILVPRSRDEAMRRFDITESHGLVKELYVVRMAQSGRSLLAEVTSW